LKTASSLRALSAPWKGKPTWQRTPGRRYALEVYLELDRTSEERSKFRDGEIFCMSGGSG
jgi:hypothetical protein